MYDGYRTKGVLTVQPPKTDNSIRKISLSPETMELMKQEHEKHPGNPYLFPSPVRGGMYHPDSVVKLHQKILKDAGLEHIRFHDLRHPYVRPKTKKYGIFLNFSGSGITARSSCTYGVHVLRLFQFSCSQKVLGHIFNLNPITRKDINPFDQTVNQGLRQGIGAA